MSDYTKSTNFAAKDALASGNAAKVVKGTEIDTEFNNIATAIATKTDDSSAAITGGTIDGTAIGGTTPAAGAFTTLSASGAASFADGTASAPAITNTGDTNTGIFFPAADTIAFAEGGTEAMRLDSSGNMGLGVTPSAWGSLKSVDVSTFGGFFGFNNQAGVTSNAYYSGTSWTYKGSGPATLYQQIGGAHNWQIATSGTAGNAITFTQAMTLDASGNLLVNRTSGSNNIIAVSTGTQGTRILAVTDNGTQQGAASFFNCTNGGENAAACAISVKANSSTSRSINAGGTINASGADYAEYMTKAGDFTVAKGDVVGINADGKLTNVFADAVSFVVKSTDPSYVGGDAWGNEEALGLTNPEQPSAEATDEEKVQYETDKAAFEAALEAARQLVDRIAFAGQVPVNVTGATAGQYIVPVNDNGAIKGEAVSNPTFEQYQQAVGKVIAIEQDGRARIIVKVA